MSQVDVIDIPPNARLLRLPQVLDRVGLKKTVVYDRIKDGTFPKPIKLGSASVWLDSDIQAWIEAQVRSAAP